MRTGCSLRPQSSTSGSGRSRNCVSTVPAEPAAVFDAGVAMGGIIAAISPCCASSMYDPAFREAVTYIERADHGYDERQQRSQRPSTAGCTRGFEGCPGGCEVFVAGVLQVGERHIQQDESPGLLRARGGAETQDGNL